MGQARPWTGGQREEPGPQEWTLETQCVALLQIGRKPQQLTGQSEGNTHTAQNRTEGHRELNTFIKCNLNGVSVQCSNVKGPNLMLLTTTVGLRL